MVSDFKIQPFDEEMSKEWDNLVLNSSVNGTFLQTRNFLNYHPKNRFKDASLVIKKGEMIVAVIPACEIKSDIDSELTLYSHRGSTYGGIIIHQKFYSAENVISMVELFNEYAKNRYSSVVMKITSDIHSSKPGDLLQYALEYNGFKNYVELNTYVDLAEFPEDVTEKFDRNKKRNIRKCEEQGLLFRNLQENIEIESFHRLLEINLSKYNLKPIHTANEMQEFANRRIPNNVKFYGVYKDDKMMAGGMMFIFENANVIHAQNLSADYRFNEYSPITYLYYMVIKQAKKDGYKALSWGISTEDKGKTLNFGLIRNKESYGSDYQLNRTYYINY